MAGMAPDGAGEEDAKESCKIVPKALMAVI